MSVQTQTCLLVTCDECGEGVYSFEDGVSLHFDEGTNLDAELRHYDWLVEDDKHYCGTCLEAMREFIMADDPAHPAPRVLPGDAEDAHQRALLGLPADQSTGEQGE